MNFCRKSLFALLLALALSPSCHREPPPDLIVVGAGISGLSAALEAARGGAQVEVIDMGSVFGGHAVVAHGGLAIVGSPVQEAAGIEDSVELAYGDFMDWGEDGDPDWVRYYVENSREEVYDWLTELGVEFEDLMFHPGNTVVRFHNIVGRGLGLVTPIYLACLKSGNVSFRWNTRVDDLLMEEGSVVGIRGTNVRTGETVERRAGGVVLATGGFQSNLEKVREFWNKDMPFPERILAGSGWNSQGYGLELAENADAQFHRLDHQWNYVTGLPDPRYEEGIRGVNALAYDSIWVNMEGERFVNECLSAKYTLPALLKQPTGSYWAVFDSEGKKDYLVTGSGWSDEKVDHLVFQNEELTKTSETLEGLAAATSLPKGALKRTVTRFNRMVDQQKDTDFDRLAPDNDPRCRDVKSLDVAPFYAIRMYPLARKSMGGIAVDTTSRVVDKKGDVIPGLYAAGEASGLAGINGKAGLEGTFLGPSIVTGRMAGRTALAQLLAKGRRRAAPAPAPPASEGAMLDVEVSAVDSAQCTKCHDLETLVESERPGYLHFELAHGVVLERKAECIQCHGELFPYEEDRHRTAPVRQATVCRNCHGL